MGVQGLWELLAPVGRRVSVETLSGKRLAIDASIWMIQFMKAMRDERGEMVSNAHILGFFRRICKLLFLRTKPVFVFDGGTPALKRRTVAARRRHRENARAKIRKTAEKLLLNHLKSRKLEELAEEIKKSKSEVKEDIKGKQVASEDDSSLGLGKANSYEQSSGFDKAINQERLDELLAASISAEEEAKLAGHEPVPTEDIKYQEEGEGGEEEEMIFPVNSGNIDSAVLASLPPSMQLDLLDQMRERLMADNRQKYQKIKKVPAKFSELQIQSYLKTVAFRREIDEVQKCASGQGFGGLQTSRIASEANREYIFSSSFIGDKQMLTPTGIEKNGGIVNQEMRTTALDATKRKLFMSPSKSTGDMSLDVATRELSQDVETYLDERGRVRVSRVRGLGIRMTRDLQRNLDLMKEHEKVFLKKDFNKIPETVSNNDASDFPKGQSQTNCIPNPSLVNEKYNHCTSASIATEGIYEEIMSNTGKSATVPAKEAAIEISFSEDEIGSKTMVDDFFMNLVSENPTTELFSESLSLEKNKDDVEQGIWEDGMVGEQNLSLKGDDIQSSFVESAGCEEDIWVVGEQSFTFEVDNIQSSFVGSKLGEEDEVLWEDSASLVTHLEESEKAVSQGSLEEEADLKEAIRRSLEDIKLKQPTSAVPVEANMATTIEDQNSLTSVKNDPNIEFRIEGDQLQSDMIDFFEEKSCFGRSNAHQFVASPNEILSTCPVPVGRFDGETTQKDDENNVAVSNSDVGLTHDIHVMEPSINQSSQENLCKIASNLVIDDSNMGKADKFFLENHPNIDFENPDSRLDTSLGNVLNNSLAFLSTNNSRIRSSMSSSSGATLGIGIFAVSSTEKMVASIDEIQQLADNDVYKDSAGGLSFIDQTSMQEEHKIAVSEANLHDEISFLKQERSFLGDERRKLERNAESVSSEMFAECQELLQMFGLPYIIAPMEAEAQCAYMEMNKLVDGIVTDDSDVFLFGARNVYKNIFDDRKYVETYFMKDIETELGLSRDKLIRIALLLGSDYTEGVSGIGIVNAIEVINAFPEKDGLLKFKEWVESPDISILRGSQYGGNLNERSSNTNDNLADGMETNIVCSASEDSVLRNDQPSDNTVPDTKKKLIFMDKHRNVSKNWHFPPSFPSESVIIAYISPQIDESIEPFTWGKPDLPLLRKICWEKFGWPTQKADDLLLPVLKEYNKHETQLRMEAFYSFNERFAKIRSQRIKKAVKGITGISSSGLTDIGGSSSKRKRGITLCNNEQSLLENDTDRPNKNERKSSKQSRKKTPIRTSPGLSEGSFKRDGVNDERGEIINARSGSEQGVRKARGRGRGKCKRGEDLKERFTESSDEEMHWSNKKVESTPEMRRSTRQRMQVNYAEDNAEINELPDIPTDEAALEHDKVTMKATTLRNDADSFSQEKLSQDYILSGGGFCLEENEIQEEEQPLPATILRKHSFEQQNDGQSQWPLEDGNCSSNFLVTGGGFCMNESDPGIAPKSNLEGDPSKGPEEACHESLQVLENLDRKQTFGDGAVQNLLSAMPSLKRKRKK